VTRGALCVHAGLPQHLFHALLEDLWSGVSQDQGCGWVEVDDLAFGVEDDHPVAHRFDERASGS
jgi:hypothetical protein